MSAFRLFSSFFGLSLAPYFRALIPPCAISLRYSLCLDRSRFSHAEREASVASSFAFVSASFSFCLLLIPPLPFWSKMAFLETKFSATLISYPSSKSNSSLYLPTCWSVPKEEEEVRPLLQSNPASPLSTHLTNLHSLPNSLFSDRAEFMFAISKSSKSSSKATKSVYLSLNRLFKMSRFKIKSFWCRKCKILSPISAHLSLPTIP